MVNCYVKRTNQIIKQNRGFCFFLGNYNYVEKIINTKCQYYNYMEFERLILNIVGVASIFALYIFVVEADKMVKNYLTREETDP